MKKRIVLISCVSKKLPRRSKARDLYISALFKLSLQYAEKLAPDGIFILSAKYELLPTDREVDPYEQTLNKMRDHEVRTWANRVLAQIRAAVQIDDTEFIFLAGAKYRKYLLPHMVDYQIPLYGLTIGKQLKRLKELTS